MQGPIKGEREPCRIFKKEKKVGRENITSKKTKTERKGRRPNYPLQRGFFSPKKIVSPVGG